MNLVQVSVCCSFVLLLANAHLRLTKRESEQRPMRLSWVPIVEPSELKNAQSLMIDIHPFDPEKSTTNQRFRARSNIQSQRGRSSIHQHPQEDVEDDEEEDQQINQNNKFTSIKQFIPGTIKRVFKHSNNFNRPNRPDFDNAEKQTINRPRFNGKQRNNNEDNFKSRSQMVRGPVLEDEDETLRFRIDNRHPFQGKDQKMPGENEEKTKKETNRSRAKKFQSQPVDDRDEDDDDTEVFTPVYMVDDGKGSVVNDEIRPLEEFDGYYDVKKDDYDDGNEDSRGWRKPAKNGRKKVSSASRHFRRQQQRGDENLGFVEALDPRESRGDEGFVPRESQVRFKGSSNRESMGKRRNIRNEKFKELDQESTNILLNKLKMIENEGYGIGIGYLSEM